jgi:beta-glucanase (GH16 family)
MPIIIYVIWGFHSGNYSRIYDNVQSTEVAITLPAKLQTIGDRIQSTVPPLYPHQVVNGQSVAVKAKKPKTTKPQIIINGPAQTNALFSTYPSWAQDFLADKSNKLDEKYWNVYQGTPSNGNNEAEYYTNKALNLHISDGALTLEATHQAEPQGYEYASALINTLGKQSFLYGRIDITAKLPIGVGTWPAAWFLPANTKYEDLSPARDSNRYLNGGEIDLIEEVGFDPNVEYGIVHSLSDLSNPGGIGDYSTINVPDNDLNYNVYSLLWTPTSITFEVDNTPFYTYTREPGADYKTWPFNQPFYLILNLAIGGTWGGEDTSQFPTGIDNSALPASMSIQSIYYYSYIGPTS